MQALAPCTGPSIEDEACGAFPGSAGIYLPAADNKTDIYLPAADNKIDIARKGRRSTTVQAGKMPALPGEETGRSRRGSRSASEAQRQP